MKPIPAIVESALAQQIKAVRNAAAALQRAERHETEAEARMVDARETAAQRRLELGRALLDARRAWPARGPNARGWGEFLAREGIEERTARRYMEAAGAQPSELDGDAPAEEQPDPAPATQPTPDRGQPAAEFSDSEFSDSKPVVSENSDGAVVADRAEPAPPELEIDRDTWCTPRWIADAIGEFDLDPCSNDRSAIHAIYTYRLDRGEDGLKLLTSKWIDPTSPKVFVNPPYSDVRPWIAAYKHTRFCFLLKLDPSTRWFAELYAATELILIPRGTRIQFEPPPGVPADKAIANQFPHALFYARAEDATSEIRTLCFPWRVESDSRGGDVSLPWG